MPMGMLTKIGAIIFVFVFGLIVVARVTGWFVPYTVPTESSEPTIKVGTYLVVCSLIQPKRMNFICFNRYNERLNEKEVYISRLCGIGGDFKCGSLKNETT